jgi:uncharacterized tellurite resistance protein B-like protein
MADRKFIMDLAKLLIAAAWADGELQNEEINSLKDLLFNLKGVSGDEWAHLEVYTDSPVSAQEREKLLSRVLSNIRSEEDKALVVTTLEKLFEADGKVTDEEEAALDEIKSAVSGVSTGFLSKLSKLVKGAAAKRDEGYKAATQKEGRVDDYVENTIYYQLKSDMQKKGTDIDLPEQKLRKLCLAAGLLARISAVDDEISEEEKLTIRQVLSTEWNLSEREADLVARISCDRTLKGLDQFRLSRGFFECTDIHERRRFLKCLFKIANASRKTSYDETEEIRKIANSLKLAHKDFIEAKLSIPDEDRELL